MGDLKEHEVTGLWHRTGQSSGKSYMGATMPMEKLVDAVKGLHSMGAQKVRILIFKNSFKEKEGQPDFQLYFCPDENNQPLQQHATTPESGFMQGDGEGYSGGNGSVPRGQGGGEQKQRSSSKDFDQQQEDCLPF